jgi:carbamoyl-phosphate synthase large subunit
VVATVGGAAQNDITREIPASFEPGIDYVVTKIPHFAFEKFPQAGDKFAALSRAQLRMKSVGEAMAIGRTFKESLQKSLRSLEIGRAIANLPQPFPPSPVFPALQNIVSRPPSP